MRAFNLNAAADYSLVEADMPKPTPGAHEVLVRMHAASLNYLDLMVAWGKFGNPEKPFIPGTDGAGEIVEIGEGVAGWVTGERVIAGSIVDWEDGRIAAQRTGRIRGLNMPGSLAEFVVVPATALARVPASLSYVQAATLPIAATTAWNAIVAANIRPGSTVALLGTGGVSLFALQFAKAAGARVIISSSSDEKLARARALGADVTINYNTKPAWDEAVLAATDGKGADLIVETIGASTFARSLNAAALAGTIYVVGFIGGTELSIPVLPIIMKTLRIIGSQTGSTANLADAARAVEFNQIEPVVDRVFPFEQTPDAYRFLEKTGHFGKIGISIA